MDKHKQKLYSFRTSESIINKMEELAKINNRTRNKEIEYALIKYLEENKKEYQNAIK